MNPEKQIQVRERLLKSYRLYLEEGYGKIFATKCAIMELKAELLDEGLDNDTVNELIKVAQKRNN